MSVSFQTGAEPIPGYKLLDRLGSGGFGEVWRCEAPGGIFKAAKVIHGDLRFKDTDAYRFAEQELKSLRRVKMVRHPYLLALDRYDIVDGRLVIVMELADCNLWDRFREYRDRGAAGIPRDELLGYMSETAEVLDLMNDKHQLQHLDIKPQNLFLLYNHVKVADFGQVKDLERHVAQVTGGITPVYAAPETFDGFVSRYCDQYSLACVYQELLTGVRPFDGSSMNQLLMQHLSQPPNLTPSPPADRVALAKALSKKPEDRFPSVTAMVAALRSGVLAPTRLAVAVATGGGDSGVISGSDSVLNPFAPSSLSGVTGGSGVVNSGRTDNAYADGYSPDGPVFPLPGTTPPPHGGTDTSAPPERPAPPEQTGPGPLRPAVVIGLGYAGMRVLQRFTKLLDERYGSAGRVPVVRTLLIDTDPDAAAAAGTTDEPEFSPLAPDGVLAVPLNRAGYYLKPRNNGRALIEGWFDPTVLYRLPRTPVTTGVRALGRLAFCDHYRAVMQKVEAEVEAALSADAMADAREGTRLDVRTNRPRVYLVAGLGGGTGGGMVFDLAYAVRHRLRRIGYLMPDVVGVLLTPPASGNVSQQARGNTFAALTELNHYHHPDTVFTAGFDEQGGLLRDADPPFARTVVLPGFDHADPTGSVSRTMLPAARLGKPGGSSGGVRADSRLVRITPAPAPDPTDPVAEFLRLDLLTPVGRAADEARVKLPAQGVPCVGTFGVRRFDWPRAAVVDRTARVIAPVLLGHWVEPDPARVRAVVPQWTDEQWQRLGLDEPALAARLRQAADRSAGLPVHTFIQQTIDPLVPKGWLAKVPDPPTVALAVDRLNKLLGNPRERTGRPIEDAVAAEAEAAAGQVTNDLMTMIPALLDTQAFRLAGSEEVVRRLALMAEQARGAVAARIAGQDAAAASAYDRLAHHMHPQKGARRASGSELGEALRDYPTQRYQSLLDRHMVGVYGAVIDALLGRLNDLAACRLRVREFHARMVAEADAPATPALPHHLLPAGCATVEEAAQKFLAVLNDDDLNELEQRFQQRITEQLGGVYETCLNSVEGPQALLRVLRTATRDYLDERMGQADLSGMMRQKFGPEQVGSTLAAAFAAAEPPLVGRGPWAQTEVSVFACQGGDGGRPLMKLATPLLPPTAGVTDTPDEVVFYREFPAVPLAALDQLGPAWAAAYKSAPDQLLPSPHARVDITRWLHVDG